MDMVKQTYCTIRYTVQLVPEHYQTIELHILSDSVGDAFAVGKEIVLEQYGYHDDLICKSEILSVEDIYGRR